MKDNKQNILQHSSIYNGFDLLQALKTHCFVGDEKSWWWPSFLSIKVESGIEMLGSNYSKEANLSFCFASILGQNTKYEYASHALNNLYAFLYKQFLKALQNHRDYIICCLVDNAITTYDNIIHALENPSYTTDIIDRTRLSIMALPIFQNKILQYIASMSESTLSMLIKRAGFHNQKAQRIILFSKNLLHEFGNFETFDKEVDKEWLLQQKGIGNESASSILNYALKREEMVVDKYTQKLLVSLGFEYNEYEAIQDFLCSGLEKYQTLYIYEISLAQVMARFHGKIVEYAKQ